MSLDKRVIEKRLKKLESVKRKLKKDFFGIDNIIDSFIDQIKIWYVMPEIQTRPLILNLWGMTGVGKTDLVRKFVRYINFNDKFIEVQMDITSGRDKIQDYLEGILESPEDQGVLLLDEIQRFRTVNEDGKEINSDKFKDIWMLLSDGRFQSDSGNRRELFSMMMSDMYWRERENDDDDDDGKQLVAETTLDSPSDESSETEPEVTEKKKKKKKKKKFKFHTYYYEARRLKGILKLKESVEEIMTWDTMKKSMIIIKGLKSTDIYEGKSYSKLLIIISGNLDEAYRMAHDVGDADLSADVFHEFSKKIDMITIKDALKRRFKPEQIARFGNIHLVYPSLDRKSFYKIINSRIKNILTNIKEKHGIDIVVHKSVQHVIYDNGVFPAQGVRPLLSTISSILENSLPKFIFEGLMRNSFPISIYYEDGKLKSKMGEDIVENEIPRAIEKIKNAKTKDTRAMVSVHEAGHAVAYALLFKVAPTQVSSRTSNKDSEGFVGTHLMNFDKDVMLRRVQVDLAGKAAEIIMFGEEYQTSGSSGDLQAATSLVGMMIRKSGMNGHLGFVLPEGKQYGTLKADIGRTDDLIDEILKENLEKVKELLKENMNFLEAVIKELMIEDKIEPEEFVKLSKVMGYKIIAQKPQIEISTNFEERLVDKLN